MTTSTTPRFRPDLWEVSWPSDAGDWGGHMQVGFGLDSELEPIELGERVSSALFDEWAVGIYSSVEDRVRSFDLLLLRRRLDAERRASAI